MGNTHLEILPGEEDPKTTGTYIYIPTDSADKVLEELPKNIKIISPIQSYPWGHRNFTIADPVGTQLKFFSLVEVYH
jgi:hypothetical protein